MSSTQRFVFIAEWFDQPADLVRQYHLIYNLNDNTIELHEIKLKKIILKKTQVPTITLKDLYIGSTLNIFSKHCKIVDYADVFTRNYFEQTRQKQLKFILNLLTRTFALIKPDAYQHIGKIISEIENFGLMITSMKMTRLSNDEVMQLFPKEQKPPQLYQEEIKFLCSDYVVGIELVGEDCIQKFLQFIGPDDPQAAKSSKPQSLRAKYGANIIQNCLHGSKNIDSANHEINFFFQKQFIKSKGILNNCSCAIIKPHIVFRKEVGKIIDRILMEGFEISAMQMLNLDKPSAEEFLEIYKGVISQFNEIVDAMVLGPCIAMEIRQENAVNSFRKLCGPYDPEICKQIRKNTIRAQFGEDIAMNAIHCTDLEEDGVLECEYFFKK